MVPQNKAVATFLQQLDRVREAKGDNLVVDDLEALFAELHGDDFEVIYGAIGNIAGQINQAKIALSARPETISGDKIPDANVELEAVVEATEEAANRIMDAAEAIQAAAENVDDVTQEKIVNGVTEIFEASNFQDLTGQRIRNVIKHLVEIDAIMEELLQALSGKVAIETHESDEEEDFEASLMNGPQNDAPSQDDIDKLFDSA